MDTGSSSKNSPSVGSSPPADFRELVAGALCLSRLKYARPKHLGSSSASLPCGRQKNQDSAPNCGLLTTMSPVQQGKKQRMANEVDGSC